MPAQHDVIRGLLAFGLLSARQLIEKLGVSQPTLSRLLREIDGELVRVGAARSIQYALRDSRRGLPDISIYRVDGAGKVSDLGVLVPVRPDGFVMCQRNGKTLHSDGLPWWLCDMKPQGYLGRAYVARHGALLNLPPRLVDWSDTHALQALLAHGDDVVGNLLLGEANRARFLAAPLPTPVDAANYVQLAKAAAQGEMPGSSAGGEQPKFTAYAQTPTGPRHVLVKFSEAEESPVSERWRDLLLAEHLALQTLRTAGVAAAASRVVDHGGQRFLELERFDRVGALGRRALLSLTALDAEFVGLANAGWPLIVQRLVADKQITPAAASGATLLWAFGRLIGNTDMHNGNLSFLTEAGRPYALAPAYDMTPMAFAPRSGGGLPEQIPAFILDAAVSNATWREARALAQDFFNRVQQESRFSPRFAGCIAALVQHLVNTDVQIARLG